LTSCAIKKTVANYCWYSTAFENRYFLVVFFLPNKYQGLSWSWSYGNWISNYLCHQCISPVKLRVWNCSWRGVLDTTLCDKVCQWLATGRWFSPRTPVSSTNKTDRHDIAKILLKVALNTIRSNLNQSIDARF
jgi:hypothetical protein